MRTDDLRDSPKSSRFSPLGCPVSISTLLPTSGEAELRLISEGTSYCRTRLALKTGRLYSRFDILANQAVISFSPLVPGHPNDL
jgi:hypothetical protein